MRILIQRVTGATVTIDGAVQGRIGQGLLLLAGIGHDDSAEDVEWLVQKIISMRIFSDEDGKMNLSVQDIRGGLLVISQFTLHASTRKGNRPSFIEAARPETAIPLYELLISSLRKNSSLQVETGIFGADMQVSLNNDGPVTIWIDSKNKA